jgi:Icc-related predicted phosphoesterase
MGKIEDVGIGQEGRTDPHVNPMRVTIQSDQHGHLIPMPECELLLLVGDIAPIKNKDVQREWVLNNLIPWLNDQKAKHIVAVAGNHDLWAKDDPDFAAELPWTYLMNSGVEVEGVRIWGSPYAMQYGRFPFMRLDPGLAEIWALIPTDTHILLTHGPAYGRRDIADNMLERNAPDPHVGSKSLRNRLEYGGYTDLKVHACGHIHEGWGHEHHDGVTYVNASYVNRRMRPQNPTVSFDLAIPER